jgi:hypothetical protein
VVEWQLNQHFKDHLCSHHQENNDKNRDGPQNVCLLTIQPPDAAAGLKMFY